MDESMVTTVSEAAETAETTVETSAPEIVEKAQEVIEAVADRNVDRNVLEEFGRSLIDYIPTVLVALVIYLIGRLIVRLTVKLIDRAVGRSRIDKAAQHFLSSLLNVIFSAIVIVIALSALGIPMTSIITVIGAAGVAIGLALQDSLSNVAGGFIILFTKPFVKGDYISVCGVEGTVDIISIINTRITTIDNKAVYIPNGQVASSTLINFSKEKKRMVERRFSVSYGADIKQVKQVIQDVVRANEKILADEPVLIRVWDLDDSAVVFIVRVWANTADYWQVWYDLAEDVKYALDENGIEIPFTQITVHNG